jgi:hypothetical protein
VTTTKPKAAAAARIGAALAARKLGELPGLLRPYFVRAGPWLQAGKYLGALASDLPRRNGWTIAQQAGDRAPQRTQRLLNRACWDTVAAMGAVRRFAVAGLDEAACRSGRRRGLRIGAIDETSSKSRERRRNRRIGGRIPVEVDVIPCQCPGFLGADPGKQTQHDIGAQSRPIRSGQQRRCLIHRK